MKQYRRRLNLLIMVAIVGAVIWVVIQTVQREDESPAGSIEPGAAAPLFEATTITGEKVRLEDYRGRTVLINFWASWCKPCVREMPLLAGVGTSSASSVETLFINVGESKGTVSDYMKAHEFSFPVTIDVTGRIAGLYRVTALPATFIIDGSGKITQAVLGEVTDLALLESWLR
ncbi:redoxin domain-containing protein [Paenibacillus donghaensis]|uniref:Thioredoxin domain-containing protein n=1 Tax=Paenibacillus donghaensis TaxID=414771 RepID=A0A2Z2K5P5_9BACL|nr:redoxin domain-containing protein [Paenibacillus donghaensis]ASA21476.1 hypothetical protein B9T62_12220 [Paenibacillus donghaensis]